MFNTKIKISDIALALANSDDRNQAELINEFAKELKIVCKDLKLEGVQPCNIARLLDKNGVDLIKSLAEFINLRERV